MQTSATVRLFRRAGLKILAASMNSPFERRSTILSQNLPAGTVRCLLRVDSSGSITTPRMAGIGAIPSSKQTRLWSAFRCKQASISSRASNGRAISRSLKSNRSCGPKKSSAGERETAKARASQHCAAPLTNFPKRIENRFKTARVGRESGHIRGPAEY